MSTPLLSTKLYIPSPRPQSVPRPRLIERLNEGLNRKLTLITASAGFGKTTLVTVWLAGCGLPAAWLSLDEEDIDPARFVTYFCAALQTIGVNVGSGVAGALQAPQPLPIESILTVLLHELAAVPHHFVLVLDDYHAVASEPIDHALAFVLAHMPPQMHLVIATREDPHFPVARLRVRNQLTELRAQDLRFTTSEAAAFLNEAMGFNLSSESIALLESRTEGWIAGLQLAALSMQGHRDVSGFIRTFTGSHHFIADYLVEEVLQQQPASVQTFLLHTSILDRMCGPLCDAVVRSGAAASGQEALEYLERANLFIVPLDNERRWYRYHHLFADLLRHRLHRSIHSSELHIRASEWFEDNGLELEAFHHAAAAQDIERAARLMEGGGMPLLFRGASSSIRNWLDSMPKEELDARPSLWVMYASALLMAGQITGVEPKLQAAEKALQNAFLDDKTKDLIGHIASIRATLAVSRHQAETIMTESRRALLYLHPDNLPVRTATTWTLGYAYHLQGDRAAASSAYTEALSISRTIGHFIITIMAALGLGKMQEADNQLHVAAETYRGVLELAGDSPMPAVCEAHLGLARIYYEWNDLDAAEQHGQQSIRLARQLEHTDRVVAGELFLARLRLATGEASGAAAILARADHVARQQHFVHQMPHMAAAHVLVWLRQGNVEAAAQLAQKHELPICRARVHLAHRDTSAAIAMLESLQRQAEAKGLEDERLQAMVVLAVALYEHGAKLHAVNMLKDALTMAEPGGFIRIFVDEGIRMDGLLREAAAHQVMPDYVGKLLAAFEGEEPGSEVKSDQLPSEAAKPLIEPLSARELEILSLIAQGLSNHEIGERLFLALSTVKGYNRNMFDKLQVKRRTEAVARARRLGLL
ncbi:LuxR family transcriptional regulator [Paenibacillus mesophilus]|uniref:LuxR C-terminal-related transcriptional regulator n=1 Tax=Paenibacillus mesophilus TaxID=2582849 RepID=UPI00110E2AF1|nr:LuxR C-terminal-related transcriptional regulator [Paenibacillus mesophilus]TMV49676.1 LuxR family transcriptional regulator [Paenibacillus mesophilus]